LVRKSVWFSENKVVLPSGTRTIRRQDHQVPGHLAPKDIRY
jgi:hypothetical protein